MRELTGYMEDVTEAVGILRDFLSMTKSIHKPDRRDINGYGFLIHLLRENSKRPGFRSLLMNSSQDSEDLTSILNKMIFQSEEINLTHLVRPN